MEVLRFSSRLFVLLTLFGSPAALAIEAASPAPIRMDEAVGVALRRNRDIIAARLNVEAAQVDRLAATIYPNPYVFYSLSNIVLGAANPQGMGLRPGPFDQSVHTIGVSEILDVWAKRSMRRETADRGIDVARLELQDAIREVVYAVRSAFADVLHTQAQLGVARETRARYDETVRLSRARFRAGDISEAELRKIELEGLTYQTAEIHAELEHEVAREHLAQVMGNPATEPLPEAADERPPARLSLDQQAVLERAMRERPDVRALAMARERAQAALRSARREAFPDPTLGVSFTQDNFVVSGDNPNTLALSVSLPLPLFDRNQGGIGHAAVDVRRAQNDAERLALQVRREVAEAVQRAIAARRLLDIYEGGMLDRAEAALRVAENSYRVGSSSLLELLEAQRTYIDARSHYVDTMDDYRQSLIDVSHAVGTESP